MSKLYVNPSLPGFYITEDDELGPAGVFVQWPDEPDGWSKREPYRRNRVRLQEVDRELAYGTGWPGAPGCGRPTRAGEVSERYTLRLAPSERAHWTEVAARSGRSLAEWMRERCAAAAALVEWSRPYAWSGKPTAPVSARGEETKGEGAGAAAEQRNPSAQQLELPGANAPL
jgi:hypothetical protein